MSSSTGTPEQTPQQHSQDTPEQKRWRAGCEKGNLKKLADREIKYIEDTEKEFGRINFDSPVYARASYRSYDGKGLMEEAREIREYRKETVEMIKNMRAQVKNKDLTVNQPEFLNLIAAGTDLVTYHITHPIPPSSEPGGSFEEAAGDWVMKWKMVVRAAAIARNPGQKLYARMGDDVLGVDWDELFAIYLKMEEITENNKPRFPVNEAEYPERYPYKSHPPIELE